eukprot:TRINITY_DN14803_c0_g1_i1.p2 TRINITY_DN14803_c0_g1~~TRINITY_DN14803_c0_g1_i1.p2  ORF type:complete len:161 (-),score=2.81 TRINITY_DN14803_c0_g1_i1:33-515(-)
MLLDMCLDWAGASCESRAAPCGPAQVVLELMASGCGPTESRQRSTRSCLRLDCLQEPDLTCTSVWGQPVRCERVELELVASGTESKQGFTCACLRLDCLKEPDLTCTSVWGQPVRCERVELANPVEELLGVQALFTYRQIDPSLACAALDFLVNFRIINE